MPFSLRGLCATPAVPDRRRISLASAPFYTSLVVVLALGVFMGVFLILNEHQAFREHISNIRRNYREQYQQRLREELDKSVVFIDQQRAGTDALIEEELRRKVQSAYTIAAHMHSMYGGQSETSDLRAMVAEVLRPIRWHDDRGAYFAGRVGDGVFDLFAGEPALEGRPLSVLRDTDGREVALELVDMVRQKGAGLLSYAMKQPGAARDGVPKIAFVKYFERFDWFIGAEISRLDLEQALQDEVLERLRQMRFGKDGAVFVFRADGTILSHRDVGLIGRSVQDLADAGGWRYGARLLEIGTAGADGGFLEYLVPVAGDSTPRTRLGFVRPYRDWNWILIASMSMDELDQAVSDQTQTYQRILNKNMVFFLILLGLAVALLILSSYLYSLRIRQGISLFTDFFRKAVDGKVKISEADMSFTEFVELGHLANRMIDDLVLHEGRQRRDEIRLDTLLRLGGMETKQDRALYDFLLERMARITRSEGGYLAKVNESNGCLTICSLVQPSIRTVSIAAPVERVSLSDAGLPGVAVAQRDVLLCNDPAHCTTASLFPYHGKLSRHLDVPLASNGKIVLVAGVCNSVAGYDSDDIHQIVLLLKGLWLHLQKAAAEEEMARLERQIIAVSEQERSSIGRDLHDDLGSHLSGVELLSKALQKKLEQENPELAGQLGTIRNLIRESIDKIRQLAHGLYPVHIIEQGIEASLESLAAEIRDLFPVRCETSFDGPIVWSDDNAATQVYYIIREAAFNAARHGRPRRVEIAVSARGGLLTATISDDGRGFDPEGIPGGIGLHTMRYRARAIGAKLQVMSRPGGGTIITLSGEVLAP